MTFKSELYFCEVVLLTCIKFIIILYGIVDFSNICAVEEIEFIQEKCIDRIAINVTRHVE